MGSMVAWISMRRVVPVMSREPMVRGLPGVRLALPSKMAWRTIGSCAVAPVRSSMTLDCSTLVCRRRAFAESSSDADEPEAEIADLGEGVGVLEDAEEGVLHDVLSFGAGAEDGVGDAEEQRGSMFRRER